jgi:hypothetical protein
MPAGLRQPVGEHAARRARPDDDVVDYLVVHARILRRCSVRALRNLEFYCSRYAWVQFGFAPRVWACKVPP